MSFLPAICSLVEDYAVGVGPVAVILCVSSMKVVDVARLCRKLLTADVQVIEGFGERYINRIVVSLPYRTIRNGMC